jgi:hypothetical protein
MPGRRGRSEEPGAGVKEDEVERLSAELKRQVRQAKERISGQMAEPRAYEPGGRRKG